MTNQFLTSVCRLRAEHWPLTRYEPLAQEVYVQTPFEQTPPPLTKLQTFPTAKEHEVSGRLKDMTFGSYDIPVPQFLTSQRVFTGVQDVEEPKSPRREPLVCSVYPGEQEPI